MILLRCVFAYFLLVVSLFANNKLDDVLSSYYQSLVEIHYFYYEIDSKTEDSYGKKILEDDLTLDNVSENDSISEVSSSTINNLNNIEDFSKLEKDSNEAKENIAIYKEIKEDNYLSLAKIFKVEDKNTKKEKPNNISKDVTLNMFQISGDNFLYYPFIVKDFDLNYLDYFVIYHNNYNFEIIKNTATDYFYKGILKPEVKKQNGGLFEEIQIKYSKKYNILTKIILKDKINKLTISIKVDSVEKVRNTYIGSKFLVYNNGKITSISLKNIQLGIPIDIENNYKITLEEYLKLINDENN